MLTAQALNLFGVSEWSARLVSFLIGTLSIPILYFPFKKILGSQVALVALFLLAISPWHITWSQNARGYTALMLFYTLALIAFYQAIEKDRPGYFILFFMFLYLAASERLIAVFILPVIVLYLILLKVAKFSDPPGFRARNLLILLSPGIALIIYQIFSSMISGQSIVADIVDEIVSTFYGNSIENPFTQTIFIVFEIGIPLIIFSFFSGLFLLAQKSRMGLLIFLSAVVPLVLVIILTPFMFTEERYAFVTLPSWIIMAAIGLRELFTRPKNLQKYLIYGIIALLIVDAAGAYLLYFHINHGNRRDWRGAFAIVEENIQEEDLVVSTWPELGAYYMDREVMLWEEMDLDAIKKSEQKIWFVVIPDMAWVTGTEDVYWWVAHNARMIDILYLRTIDNANIEIYLFDPAQNSFITKTR
jgi:4-amino-4-deoxy-L-arabinose transferase-like glycosyltransferase